MPADGSQEKTSLVVFRRDQLCCDIIECGLASVPMGHCATPFHSDLSLFYQSSSLSLSLPPSVFLEQTFAAFPVLL